MGRLAVIGKHAMLGEPRGVAVDAPVAGVIDGGEHLVLYRHGIGDDLAPHEIDHAAHLRTLVDLDCDRVLAVSSVGGLRLELAVGTFIAPDDFIALDQSPIVAVDTNEQHVVPGFTPAWRERVIATWRAQIEVPLIDGGVYWQTSGPRFETPAEIRMIATYADVVGMTVASECVAANQLGIAYAAVCVVDNLANGLGAALLTPEEYALGQAQNRDRLLSVLARMIPDLAR